MTNEAIKSFNLDENYPHTLKIQNPMKYNMLMKIGLSTYMETQEKLKTDLTNLILFYDDLNRDRKEECSKKLKKQINIALKKQANIATKYKELYTEYNTFEAIIQTVNRFAFHSKENRVLSLKTFFRFIIINETIMNIINTNAHLISEYREFLLITNPTEKHFQKIISTKEVNKIWI